MPPRSILFDFDGTLIDSAPGILASFEAALRQTGITPAVPLVASLIGPPLPVTAAALVGRDDPVAIDALGLQLLDRFRQEGGLPLLSKNIGWIQSAEAIGLGAASRERIRIIPVY